MIQHFDQFSKTIDNLFICSTKQSLDCILYDMLKILYFFLWVSLKSKKIHSHYVAAIAMPIFINLNGLIIINFDFAVVLK